MCVAHAVAHTDHTRSRQRRPRPDAPWHHCHRVGVVEEEDARTAFGHLVRHLDHNGDCAKASHDSADADRVRDRLAQSILLRDLEIREGCLVPPDLDLVDDVVGTVERRSGRLVRGHQVPGLRSLDLVSGGALRVREPLGVDVVQRDVEGAVELLVGAEVGDDASGELDAPCPQDGDIRHVRKASMTHSAGGSP